MSDQALEHECAKLNELLRKEKETNSNLDTELTKVVEEYAFLKQVSEFSTRELQQMRLSSTKDEMELDETRNRLQRTIDELSCLKKETFGDRSDQEITKKIDIDDLQQQLTHKKEEIFNLNLLLQDIKNDLAEKLNQIEVISSSH